MRKKICLLLAALCVGAVMFGCGAKEAVPETKVPALTLFPADEAICMAPGQSVQLTAIMESGESTSRIVWKSSDESAAAVSQSGRVSAANEGEVVITACIEGSEDQAAQVKITVLPNVKGLEIQQEEITVLTGKHELSYLPECKIVPENAYYQGVKWTSSDESVAVAGDDGSIFPVSAGKCTFTGISEDPACRACVTCEVTVKIGIDEIELHSASDLGYVGKKLKISAKIHPENAEIKSLSWESSDESIASVDQQGNVNCLEAGNVTITCNADDGASASLQLEVVKGTKALIIDQKNVKLLLGGKAALASQKLSCTLIPEDTSFADVTWESSDETIAAVDAEGNVTALAEGSCTISAVSNDPAANAKASLRVTVGQAVQKIALVDPPSQLAKGSRYKLSAQITPANAMIQKLLWTSADDSILSVDGQGNLMPRAAGETTIRCEATDGSGVYASMKFTVIQRIEKLSYSENRLVVTAGTEEVPEIEILPESASSHRLHYESSNPAVASVTPSGKVRGLTSGRCTITAKSMDGGNASISIPVIVEPAVPVSAVKLGRTGYNGYYNEFTATFKNLTATKTISAIDFTLEYKAEGDRGTADFRESELSLTPGRTAALASKKASGLNFADSFTIYLTGITYADGTEESFDSIPVGHFENG